MYGAIEAGGTKFVCAVGAEPNKILKKISFPTTSSAETLKRACDFFRSQIEICGDIRAIGVGSFGPVGVSPNKKNYGVISSTPKPGWSGVNIVNTISRKLGVQVVLETDVNCALLGESAFGAGRGIGNFVYVTVGTGIGAGVLVDRRILKGFSHPEVGHMLTPKHPSDAHFKGVCPFHKDRCFEGLASGPAIEKRWNCMADQLETEHDVWQLQGYYLSVLCLNLFLVLAPQAIVLGGGVMKQKQLFGIVRSKFEDLLANYIDLDVNGLSLNKLIVPAELDGDAGIMGCILLAKQHLGEGSHFSTLP